MRKLLVMTMFTAFMSLGAAAHATIVNLSATEDPTKDPGPEFTSVMLSFGPGAYAVAPVDPSTPHALHTAAKRFDEIAGCNAAGLLCTSGWEHTYYVRIGDGAPVKYGFGEGQPPDPQGTAYHATAALAFANGVTSTFTLGEETLVTFSWLDDTWGDNTGGISLSVTAIPEPSSAVLVLASLLMLGSIARRRMPR